MADETTTPIRDAFFSVTSRPDDATASLAATEAIAQSGHACAPHELSSTVVGSKPFSFRGDMHLHGSNGQTA